MIWDPCNPLFFYVAYLLTLYLLALEIGPSRSALQEVGYSIECAHTLNEVDVKTFSLAIC